MSPSVEPFNAEKYKALMDGLECSEVMYRDITANDNFTQRIDSEYFLKQYAMGLALLCSKYAHNTLSFRVGGGKRLPLNETFSESGVKYVRAEDVKNEFLDISNSPYISQSLHARLHNYVTKYNDILITIVGNSIGDVAINRLTDEINLTENCVRLYGIDKEYGSSVFFFLLSKYGQMQILREKVGTAQPKLSIERIRKFLIPKFGKEFATKAENILALSWQHCIAATEIFGNAERLLQEVLCVNQLQINTSNYSVKALSDSLDASGRLDSEYYQSKYDQLFAMLQNFDCKKLGGENGLVTIKKSIEPGSELYCDEGIDFVRVSDISREGIETPDIKIPENTVNDIYKLFPKKDTILLSKDGSVGVAYKVDEDTRCVTSGALLHLKVKNQDEIQPDYLTLVLNSPIVQMQAERDAGGSIIQHWKPSEIEEVIIPILPLDKQIEISNLVKKSFALKKQAKQLLDNAIKAVEMAIETDEETAIAWLSSQE